MARTPRDRRAEPARDPRRPASRGAGPPHGGNRRALSQNFLTDPTVARHLVRAAGITRDDLVVEVGAGDGMLTRHLAPACRELIAYEVDPRFAARLANRHRDTRVRVVQADFVRATPPPEPFTVVGNIPYAITAEIVDWCLNARGMTSASLITQLEYARKRTGDFGRWSLLTVRTWPRFEWLMGRRVPRDRFAPVPRVDSGVLHLRRRRRCLLPPATLGQYRRLVELGFTGVGGSLRASLRRAHPARRVDAALEAAEVTRAALVSDVSPDQWVTLFAHLHGTRPLRE